MPQFEAGCVSNQSYRVRLPTIEDFGGVFECICINFENDDVCNERIFQSQSINKALVQGAVHDEAFDKLAMREGFAQSCFLESRGATRLAPL